jgi:hypothetical protein
MRVRDDWGEVNEIRGSSRVEGEKGEGEGLERIKK